MNLYPKRRRKLIAPLLLATWLLATFISAAHACGVDHALAHHGGTTAASAVAPAHDDGALPACEQFCADDIPLLLEVAHDAPFGPTRSALGVIGGRPPSAMGTMSSPARAARPQTIRLTLRFLRLAL